MAPRDYLKSKIAVIGGNTLSHLNLLRNLLVKQVNTPFGRILYYSVEKCPFLLRHGLQGNIPPHKINHKANIFALKKLRKRFIFSFNSVGSLKKDIKPGQFLVPDDYIGFDTATFYDKECRFVTPRLSSRLRGVLIEILKSQKLKFQNKGIYFETKGPRLETKAEISLIKNYADVVGMTMAKEATLAQELEMDYASLCSVDNFAQGLVKKPLTIKEIKQGQSKMKNKIEKVLEEILGRGRL
jgi:5'-methylthioadenosine phosphorylase